MRRLGGVLGGLGGILEASWRRLGGVLEAMLSQDRSKKAQDAKTLNKTKEEFFFGLPRRCLGCILGRLVGSGDRLDTVLKRS